MEKEIDFNRRRLPLIDGYVDKNEIKEAFKDFLSTMQSDEEIKSYQGNDLLLEMYRIFNNQINNDAEIHFKHRHKITSYGIEIKKVIEDKELVSLLITNCKSDALLFKILQNIYKNNKDIYFKDIYIKDILQNVPSILQDRYKEGYAETDDAKKLIDFIKKIGKDYGLGLDIYITSPKVETYKEKVELNQTNPKLLEKIREQEERTEKLGLSGGWFSRLFGSLFGKSAEYKLMLEVFDWKKEVTPDDFQRLLATYSIKDLKWLEKIYSILFSKGNKARTENKEASFKYDFLEMLNKHISGLVDNKKPDKAIPSWRREYKKDNDNATSTVTDNNTSNPNVSPTSSETKPSPQSADYGYKNNTYKETEYNVPLSETPWENQPWKLTEPLSDRKPDDGKLVTEEPSKTSGQSKGEQADIIDGDGIVGPYFGNISHKPSNTDTQQDPTLDGDVHQSSVTGKEYSLLGDFSIPTNTGTLNESVLKPDTHNPVTSDVVVSNTQSPQDTTQKPKGKGKKGNQKPKGKGKGNPDWGKLLKENEKWEGKNKRNGKPGSKKILKSQQEEWEDTLENSQLTSDEQPLSSSANNTNTQPSSGTIIGEWTEGERWSGINVREGKLSDTNPSADDTSNEIHNTSTKSDTKTADTQSELTETRSSTSLSNQANISLYGPVNISSQPNTSSTQDEASSTSSIRQSGEASPQLRIGYTPSKITGRAVVINGRTELVATTNNVIDVEAREIKSKWYEKAWNKSQELVNSAKERASNLGIKSIKILKGVGGVVGNGLNQMSSAIDKARESVDNFDLKKWTLEKKESLVKIAREQQERIKSLGLGEWAKSSVLGEKEEIMIYKRDSQNNIMTDEKGNRMTEMVQKRRRITKMPTHEIKLDEKTIKNRVGLVRSWEKQKRIFNDVGLKGNVLSILDKYNNADKFMKNAMSGIAVITTGLTGGTSKYLSSPFLGIAKYREAYKKSYREKFLELAGEDENQYIKEGLKELKYYLDGKLLSKQDVNSLSEEGRDKLKTESVFRSDLSNGQILDIQKRSEERVKKAKKYANKKVWIKGLIWGGVAGGAGLLGEYWRGEGAGKYVGDKVKELGKSIKDEYNSILGDNTDPSTAKDMSSENKTDGSVIEKKDSVSNPATPASGVASSPSTPSSAPNISGIGAGNTASVDNSYTPNGNQTIDITNYNNYKIQKGDNLENIFEKYMNNEYEDKRKDDPERLKEIYNMFANPDIKKMLEEQGVKYVGDNNGGTFPNLIQTGGTLNLNEIFNKAQGLGLITEK